MPNVRLNGQAHHRDITHSHPHQPAPKAEKPSDVERTESLSRRIAGGLISHSKTLCRKVSGSFNAATGAKILFVCLILFACFAAAAGAQQASNNSSKVVMKPQNQTYVNFQGPDYSMASPVQDNQLYDHQEFRTNSNDRIIQPKFSSYQKQPPVTSAFPSIVNRDYDPANPVHQDIDLMLKLCADLQPALVKDALHNLRVELQQTTKKFTVPILRDHLAVEIYAKDDIVIQTLENVWTRLIGDIADKNLKQSKLTSVQKLYDVLMKEMTDQRLVEILGRPSEKQNPVDKAVYQQLIHVYRHEFDEAKKSYEALKKVANPGILGRTLVNTLEIARIRNLRAQPFPIPFPHPYSSTSLQTKQLDYSPFMSFYANCMLDLSKTHGPLIKLEQRYAAAY